MPFAQTSTYKLNFCAVVVRQYNLGDKSFFIERFKRFEITRLESAWNFAEKNIQNNEIIKDASNISLDEAKIAQFKYGKFGLDINPIQAHLKSEFNPKKLNLREENIERRFRHLLAEGYLKREIPIIERLDKEINKSTKQKFGEFISENFFWLIITLAVTGFFMAPKLIDRLSSVDTLTERIHERSKYKFSGAICNDGWTSHSQGSGTCSHHDGVNYYFEKGEYSKSLEQCKREAIEISWFAP